MTEDEKERIERIRHAWRGNTIPDAGVPILLARIDELERELAELQQVFHDLKEDRDGYMVGKLAGIIAGRLLGIDLAIVVADQHMRGAESTIRYVLNPATALDALIQDLRRIRDLPSPPHQTTPHPPQQRLDEQQ